MTKTIFLSIIALVPITLFVLEFVYYSVKKEMALDQARANLFKIRNDLLLYAIENGIEDKDAHNEIRKRLNIYIRFVHRADIINFITFNVLCKTDKNLEKETNKIVKEINKIIQSAPEKHRSFFKGVLEKGKDEIFQFMVFSSPGMSILFHIFNIIFNTKKFMEEQSSKYSLKLELEIEESCLP